VIGHSQAPARHHARGVSLVELMVALVLGLIVTGSALTLVLTNRQTFTATENLSRVQESARVAYELMNRELRSAGANPCDSSLMVFNGLVDMDASWFTNWGDRFGNPVAPSNTDTAAGLMGYAGGAAFADAAFGTNRGDRIAGTDAVELKAAVPITANNAIVTVGVGSPGTDEITVNAATGVEDGDLLLICNFNNATVFRVTDVGATKIELGQGAAADSNANAFLPRTNTTIAYDAGSTVSRVRATRWYIGANGRDTDGDGVADGRSLFRTSLVNNAGALQVSTDEIAPGITGMQLGYLVAGGADYVGAGAIANWSDEANPVVAVRIELTLEGEDRVGPNGESIARTLVHTVALRGRAG
jgi:type IV pilus assembly protein PilW